VQGFSDLGVLFYGWGEVAHFNAYNRPKPEVEKYGSTLAVCLWVPYKGIGGRNCPSLPNGNVGLGVI
jgi:hypothetical protein